MINHKALFDKIIAKEQQYKDTHFVFYHAQNFSLRIPQDLNKALCKLRKTCPNMSEFTLLRAFDSSYFNLPDINTWMDSKEHFLKDPNTAQNFNYLPEIQPYLLATNLALFGNIGRLNSNTIYFFIKSITSSAPTYGTYNGFSFIANHT